MHFPSEKVRRYFTDTNYIVEDSKQVRKRRNRNQRRQIIKDGWADYEGEVMVRSLSRSSRRRITSWRSADNLLQAARKTSATWRHAQGANHRLYTAAWTKDSPNHTLKEPTYTTWTQELGARIGCRWRGRFCNLREAKHKSKGVEISLWNC